MNAKGEVEVQHSREQNQMYVASLINHIDTIIYSYCCKFDTSRNANEHFENMPKCWIYSILVYTCWKCSCNIFTDMAKKIMELSHEFMVMFKVKYQI